MSLPFLHPATILIAGPTMSGKTQFLSRVIASRFIHPSPERIVIVYNEWQPAYEKLKKHFPIEFVRGPITPELYESFNADQNNLLVMDDQMLSATKSDELSKLFVQGAHHRNLSIIFIVQNIFDHGKAMRTTSINSNYIVLFKNPRDKLQPAMLARQIFPAKSKSFVAAYSDAT